MTDLGPEDIETVLADSFLGAEPGNFLGRTIERGYHAIFIDREDPIVDTVEYETAQ